MSGELSQFLKWEIIGLLLEAYQLSSSLCEVDHQQHPVGANSDRDHDIDKLLWIIEVSKFLLDFSCPIEFDRLLECLGGESGNSRSSQEYKSSLMVEFSLDGHTHLSHYDSFVSIDFVVLLSEIFSESATFFHQVLPHRCNFHVWGASIFAVPAPHEVLSKFNAAADYTVAGDHRLF
jgi:hypothetical protein